MSQDGQKIYRGYIWLQQKKKSNSEIESPFFAAWSQHPPKILLKLRLCFGLDRFRPTPRSPSLSLSLSPPSFPPTVPSFKVVEANLRPFSHLLAEKEKERRKSPFLRHQDKKDKKLRTIQTHLTTWKRLSWVFMPYENQVQQYCRSYIKNQTLNQTTIIPRPRNFSGPKMIPFFWLCEVFCIPKWSRFSSILSISAVLSKNWRLVRRTDGRTHIIVNKKVHLWQILAQAKERRRREK